MNTIIKQKGHEHLIGSRLDLTELIAQNIGLNTTTKIPKSYTGPYYKYAKHLEYKPCIYRISIHLRVTLLKKLAIRRYFYCFLFQISIPTTFH